MQTLLKDYRILYQRNQAIVGTAICTISQIMPTTAASGYFLREAESTMARLLHADLREPADAWRGPPLHSSSAAVCPQQTP